MRRALLIVAALASLSVVACKAPPTTVACNVVDPSTLACTIDGVTIAAPIPADIAAVIGLVEPGLRLQSVQPSTIPPFIQCTADTRSRVATCTNTITGRAGSYHLDSP